MDRFRGEKDAASLGWEGWRVGRMSVVIADGWMHLAVDEAASRADRVDAAFAPVVEPRLLETFLGVRTESDVAAFAKQFGELGWHRLHGTQDTPTEWPLVRDYRARRGAASALIRRGVLRLQDLSNLWLTHSWQEPVAWVLAHAATLRWCQDLWLLERAAGPGVPSSEWPDSPDFGPSMSSCTSPLASALAVRKDDLKSRSPAALAVMRVLSPHLERVHQSIELDSGKPRLGLRARCLLDEIYSLLATRLVVAGSENRLRRCEECGMVIEISDPRQKYCHPRSYIERPSGSKPKSACEERRKARQRRERLRAQGLTSRGTPRVRSSVKRPA